MVVRIQSAASAQGRLSRIDVGEVWSSEAIGFTPWLAQEKNLQLLAEIFKMQLVLEAKEKPVGMFRADTIAHDVHTGHPVLIENQLERTDHGHLGQQLPYAAGLNAMSIVWVFTLFTNERAHASFLARQTFDCGEEINYQIAPHSPGDLQREDSIDEGYQERKSLGQITYFAAQHPVESSGMV